MAGDNGRRERRPAFDFYPGDFLSSPKVRRMSLEQIGAYVVLLCDSWTEAGLPSDHQDLAHRLGVDQESFERIWEAVGRCFEKEDGRYFNPRLERERDAADAFSKTMSEAGKRGAAAKKASAKASQATATLQPGHSHPSDHFQPGSAPTPPHPTPPHPNPPPADKGATAPARKPRRDAKAEMEKAFESWDASHDRPLGSNVFDAAEKYRDLRKRKGHGLYDAGQWASVFKEGMDMGGEACLVRALHKATQAGWQSVNPRPVQSGAASTQEKLDAIGKELS